MRNPTVARDQRRSDAANLTRPHLDLVRLRRCDPASGGRGWAPSAGGLGVQESCHPDTPGPARGLSVLPTTTSCESGWRLGPVESSGYAPEIYPSAYRDGRTDRLHPGSLVDDFVGDDVAGGARAAPDRRTRYTSRMEQWENEGGAPARREPPEQELERLRDQEAARDAATQALIAERDHYKADSALLQLTLQVVQRELTDMANNLATLLR